MSSVNPDTQEVLDWTPTFSSVTSSMAFNIPTTTVQLTKDAAQHVLEYFDPFGPQFLDFRYPVDVWNYIIFCLPFVIFVTVCTFIWFPWVFHFFHWAPKLLWPKLVGFPLLHELLRRFINITNPQPPSFGDFIKYFERLHNLSVAASKNSTTETLGSLLAKL